MAVSAASGLNTPAPHLGRLLVVDDEPALLAALVEMLTRQGYQAAGFGSGVEALRALQEQEFDLLLTDLMMPELDGIALLRAGLVLDPNLMGILMTGQGTVKTAVEAMQVGAFDYVLKPFKLSAVLPILARALDVRRLRLDNLQLRETVAIYELTQAIAYTLDLNTILNKTADAALQQCEADEASIMLPTPDGQELVVAAVRGEQRGQLLGERVPIGEGIAGWVAREHGPLTLPGEVRDPRFAPLYPRPEIQSAVSIPMLSGNQLIGVLNVNLIKGRRRFTLGQVKALSILVSTAAAALENARLHAQVTATEERFRALIENSSDGIVLIDARGAPQYVSPSITRILGYTVEELPGVWPHLIHPDDALAMRHAIVELSHSSGQLLTAQYRFRHQAGGWRWLETVVSNLLDNPNVAAIVINYRDITERKQAEAALRESEVQFRAIFEQAAVGMAQVGPDGRWLRINQRLCDIFGYTAEELLAKSFQSISHPDDVKTDVGNLQRMLANELQSYAREKRYIRKDGSTVWANLNASLVREATGAPKYFVSVIADITDRKQAEAALRQSEERFRTWIENSSDLISVVDLHGLIRYQSPSVQRLLGYGQQDLVGQSAFDFVHPDDTDRILELFAANIQTPEATATAEYRFRHHDGSWRVLEGTGKAYVDERGEALGLITSRDITERKWAQEEIQRLAKFPSENPSPVLRLAPDGTVRYANERSRPLLALWTCEVGTRPPAEVCQIVVESYASLTRREVEVNAGGAVYSLIFAPVTGMDYVNVYGRDITDRKQAEVAVAKTNDLLSQAEQIGHMGSWELNLVTNEERWSDGLYRLYGLRPQATEPTFDDFLNLVHPEDRERVRQAVDQGFQGGRPFDYECRIVLLDGRERSIYARSELRRDEGGQPARQIGIALDITERKQAEAALAAAHDLMHRAELIGRLGSWEFNLTTQRERWSDGLYRMFGLEPQVIEPGYEAYLDRIHPDDRERVRQTIDAQMQDRLPAEYECRIVRADGSQRIMLVKAEFVFDDRGMPARRIGIDMDITERKQRERELEALVAVSTALRAAGTRAEMLPILLNQIMTIVEASAGAIFLADPATGELVVELAQGEMAALAGKRLPPGAGISGHVLATRQPFSTSNAEADPHGFELDWIRQARAAACVPLVAQGRALGLVWAGRARPFEVEELSVLGAIANMAANALHRAALQDQTEQRLRRLAALRAIDLAISASMELQLTLNIVLDQVMAQLQVDAADVFLLQANGDFLEIAARQGYRSEAAPNTRLQLGEWYAGRVALERRVIGVPDFSQLDVGAASVAAFEAEGFRAYYGVPLISKGAVTGVLEVLQRAPLQPDSDWLDFLEALAGQAAIAIDNARLFEDVQRSNIELGQAYDATIEGWSRALDLRDHETEGHSQRVTELTLRLARRLGRSDEELVHIRRGALLHDIGKMGIPDPILLKPGPLTEAEWAVMRQHPTYAYELLKPIAFLNPALDIPYCHHEKWDGTGYPQGLKGEQIPLAARLFAVVDVWDALRSDRPYRPAWSAEKTHIYMCEQAGSHFDPEVVKAFWSLGPGNE